MSLLHKNKSVEVEAVTISQCDGASLLVSQASRPPGYKERCNIPAKNHHHECMCPCGVYAFYKKTCFH